MWIDLRQSKTKMILCHSADANTAKTHPLRYVSFCLSVCHLLFVDSELERRSSEVHIL